MFIAVLFNWHFFPRFILVKKDLRLLNQIVTITKNGIILIEKDLVQPKKVPSGVKTYAIPATRFAEEMGRKIIMNIITVGFFSAITQVTSHDATRKAVESSVPPGTQELNLKAFETGYQYGKKLLEEKPTKAKSTKKT